MKPVSRRQFLGQASCAAVGSVGILSTLLNLRMANAAAAQALGPTLQNAGEDYRALVCLFLSGGIDSYNLLVPADGSAYTTYSTTRGGTDPADGGLALPQSSLLLLPSGAGGGLTRFGVHPSLADHAGTAGLRSLFEQGRLGWVTNVGTLVERVTKAQYTSSTAKLPRGLYSHADQIQQWQTSVPIESRGIGWAGLAADLLHAGNADARVSMNISLSGSNVWQTGRDLFAYSISSNGSILPSEYNPPGPNPSVGSNNRTAIRTAGIDNLLQQEYANLFDRAFNANLRGSIDASDAFTDAYTASTLTTAFPGDAAYTYPAGFTSSNDPARSLAQQFKAVARTIKARQQLGMRRQTFFVQYGGWDHHDEVINNMNRMVDVVNRAVSAFWLALGEIDMRENVVTFTASDFGRTLTSNGNGSDHAWGSNQWVLGGPVAGGRIYGTYPDLALNGPQIVTNRGVTIPGWSVDEYFGELALWLGVPPSRLSDVLPRSGIFFSPATTPRPIGFLPVA